MPHPVLPIPSRVRTGPGGSLRSTPATLEFHPSYAGRVLKSMAHASLFTLRSVITNAKEGQKTMLLPLEISHFVISTAVDSVSEHPARERDGFVAVLCQCLTDGF